MQRSGREGVGVCGRDSLCARVRVRATRHVTSPLHEKSSTVLRDVTTCCGSPRRRTGSGSVFALRTARSLRCALSSEAHR